MRWFWLLAATAIALACSSPAADMGSPAAGTSGAAGQTASTGMGAGTTSMSGGAASSAGTSSSAGGGGGTAGGGTAGRAGDGGASGVGDGGASSNSGGHGGLPGGRAGAAGGAGDAGNGGASAVCDKVKADYAAELELQLACNPKAGSPCSDRVRAAPGCECRVFIEPADPFAIEHLSNVASGWFDADCGTPSCPTQCATADAGTCQADANSPLGGRCITF